MPDTARALAIVPARGGSKGLPGKNIRPLAGKPLIGWTIEAALAARHIDRVVVSSDDPQILRVAAGYGSDVPLPRPAALARDDTPSIDVVMHVLERFPHYEWVILLQPTSPLRPAADIDAATDLCLANGAPCCVSVVEAGHSPWWMFRLEDHRLHPVMAQPPAGTRRQDLPPVYALNGAIYVARTDWLRASRSFLTPATLAYPMPRERSVDIDDRVDFRLAEALLAEHQPAAAPA